MKKKKKTNGDGFGVLDDGDVLGSVDLDLGEESRRLSLEHHRKQLDLHRVISSRKQLELVLWTRVLLIK